MTDLDRSIQNLGDKIDELAVQVSSLTNTVNRVERNLDRQIEETRELRLVTQKQTENIAQMSENIAQLIALAQQQQATVDRLLSKN